MSLSKVQKPEKTELAYLDKSKTLIGFFWPGQNEEALKAARKTGATVIAMDMVPRISRAQKDGRVVLNGEYRWLSCGHRGRQ